MTLLDLERIDLDELSSALEDNSPEHEWFLDPDTGVLEFRSAYQDPSDEWDPDELGMVRVDPIDSDEAYGDMEDFISLVAEPRPRDLLERAISGRGAFRRFKDTLFEFPELREAWFRFHDSRMRGRAITWLRGAGLIADADAARAIATLQVEEQPLRTPVRDAISIARAVAADLRELYAGRLREVLLFGSWARGDAHPDSDIDLLVVLDEVGSRRRELARMDEVLWRHSLATNSVITEIPVSETELRESDVPVIVRARAEGVPVA